MTISCASSALADPSTIDDAVTLMKSQPKKGELQKIFVPYDKDSGWFVENNAREEMILLKLRECDNIKATVVPVCEKQAEPVLPTPPKFYEQPAFLLVMSSLALIVGAGMGITYQKQKGK